MNNVVSIPNIYNLDVLIATEVFPDGHNVGHYLTRVIVVSKAIDNGGAGVLSKIHNILVVEQTGHNHVIIPAQDASNVIRGLALAQLYVIRTKVQSVTPQLEKTLQ